MSAVIRIKRHIDEEPLSAFLLNCKKRRTSDPETTVLQDGACGSSSRENDTESTTQILKFAGTVTKPEDITNHILKISKDEAKELVSKKSRIPNLTEKNRVDLKTQSQNSRFKIVNCTRGLESSTNDDSAKSLTILDVEKEDTPKNKKLQTIESIVEDPSISEDDRFVFDVYVPENHYHNNDRIASDNLLNFDDISVVEYVEDLYGLYRNVNGAMIESDLSNDGSDDSNAENNWRNDYPDDEEGDRGSSIGENEMRRAMEDFDIDVELSSDEDNAYGNNEENKHDGFVYSIDSEAIGFEDDLDYCDVNRYGEAYARYKKRILKNSDNNYLPKNYDDDGSDDYSD